MDRTSKPDRIDALVAKADEAIHKLDATLASLAREPVVSRLGSQVVRAA